MTKEQILSVLKQSKFWAPHWADRGMHVSNFDSYNHPDNRITTFVIEGSPPKLIGVIYRNHPGFRMIILNINFEHKKLYFTEKFKLVTRHKLNRS